jgi:hypothetical protein
MLETAPTPFEKTVAHVALIALAIQTHEVNKLEAGLLEAFAMSQEPAEA